ncbi:MAG: FHA domain-containing protein [Deltaproteobacteria bacterium]|nr:FHA domain-containing protein [Deltaproteobacteria bacterium]
MMKTEEGDITTKGPPIADVQFPMNQQLVAEVTKLKEEEGLLKERLEKIEATRSDVSPTVYERVRGDYQRRYSEVHRALQAKKGEVDQELATLHEARDRILTTLATHKEGLEEIQLRHSLGEFAETDFQERAGQAGEKIRKFEKLLAAINNNIRCYEGLFAGVVDHPAITPSIPVHPASAVVEPPLTSVLGDELAAADEEYLLEEDAADYFNAEPAPQARETTDPHLQMDAAKMTGPRLTIVRGNRKGEAFPIQAETTIGRAAGSTVVLKEAKISRQHAVIRRKGAKYVIEDLQSSNGLFVNGERVHTQALADGDEVQIGDFLLKFHA